MKKIEPYRSVDQALASLDNGGRFYSSKIKKNDGIINQAELEGAGGLSKREQQMILFLQMSIWKLTDSEKTVVFSKLDGDLMHTYQKYKPQELNPSVAIMKAQTASNVIMTGFPKLLENTADFDGTVLFPKNSGSTTIFAMTPIKDEYHVYELEEEGSAHTFLIAHVRGTEKLSNKKMVLGGVIKELHTNGDEATKPFLEAAYHFGY